jgi:hypothetical protein
MEILGLVVLLWICAGIMMVGMMYAMGKACGNGPLLTVVGIIMWLVAGLMFLPML